MNVNKITTGIIKNHNAKTKEKTNNKNETTPQIPTNKKRVGAAILAGLMLASLSSQGKPLTAQAETTYTGSNYIDTINPEDISYSMQPLNGTYIEQTDFSMPFLPVAEFYLPRGGSEVFLEPNQDVPRTPSGSIIIDITSGRSSNNTEAATLMEVINKTYSDALAEYDEDTQTNIRNKVIDEIIQGNPDLAEYLFSLDSDVQSSYRLLETRRLDLSGCDSIIIPSQIVYQPQTQENNSLNFSQKTYTHKPEMETASVVGNSSYLLEGEFETLPDLIYGVYGDDISTEAYRDILYAVVNAPENAEYFEHILNDMNFNKIIQAESITDINRTLEENTSGVMLNLTMPTVKTTRVIPSGYNAVSGDKNDIIYQISPARVGSNQAERSISLTSRGDRQKESGDVYDLVDVLQFYASPDGNGRFAEIDRNGWLILNDDINYFTPFATQILQQVIYANLNIFTAPYEDENGVHPYGVFDVNNGYDVEGKTLEEIIENSTINLDRMNNFSFMDENGISLFEEGTELNLPQFNYRINFCEKRTETPQATTTPEPTQSCDPTPTVPPETEEPPTITPGPTQSCDPTPTVPAETEEPPTITPGPTTPAPEATEIPSATDVPVDEPNVPQTTSCPTTPPSEEVEEEETPIITPTNPEITSCPTSEPSIDVEEEEAPVIIPTTPQDPSCPTSEPTIDIEEEESPTVIQTSTKTETTSQTSTPIEIEECNDIPMSEDIEVEEPPTL